MNQKNTICTRTESKGHSYAVDDELTMEVGGVSLQNKISSEFEVNLTKKTYYS